jgi:hypothetical protein
MQNTAESPVKLYFNYGIFFSVFCYTSESVRSNLYVLFNTLQSVRPNHCVQIYTSKSIRLHLHLYVQIDMIAQRQVKTHAQGIALQIQTYTLGRVGKDVDRTYRFGYTDSDT